MRDRNSTHEMTDPLMNVILIGHIIRDIINGTSPSIIITRSLCCVISRKVIRQCFTTTAKLIITIAARGTTSLKEAGD
jgi:hypothetical protein